jgi:hypothetical protein
VFGTALKSWRSSFNRLYFGAYKEDYTEQPLYAGRQTVVLVATKAKDTPHGEANKDIYIQTDKGNTILAYNAGQRK